MDFETQLAGFSPAKDLATWMSASFSHIQQTLTTRESELKAAQIKIQALTLALAHHRRIRFGHKNEALSPEQRDLFQETLDTDHGAIQAEIEQAAPAVRAPQVSGASAPCPIICHVTSSGTSPNHAPAANAVRRWLRSVKM